VAPVTILENTNAEADALFAALAAAGQLLFVYPNSDAGSYALIERTRALSAMRGNTRVFINLDATTYWSLLGHVDCIVGNSSSGIMEAASFALPVVNVGMRQQGRERAATSSTRRPKPRPFRRRSTTRCSRSFASLCAA